MNAWDTQEGGSHYKKLAIQPMQYALANGLDYGQSNVVKYVTRFKDKHGKQDLLKARHCIDLLIAHYYPDTPDQVPVTPQVILDAIGSTYIVPVEKCDTAQKSDCEHRTENGCVGCVKWGESK